MIIRNDRQDLDVYKGYVEVGDGTVRMVLFGDEGGGRSKKNKKCK